MPLHGDACERTAGGGCCRQARGGLRHYKRPKYLPNSLFKALPECEVQEFTGRLEVHLIRRLLVKWYLTFMELLNISCPLWMERLLSVCGIIHPKGWVFPRDVFHLHYFVCVKINTFSLLLMLQIWCDIRLTRQIIALKASAALDMSGVGDRAAAAEK